MNPNKKSAVWKYFQTLIQNSLVATCNICHADVYRTSFNTTNLIGHLRANHEDEYLEFITTTRSRAALEKEVVSPPRASKNKKTFSNLKAKISALDDRLNQAMAKEAVLLRLLWGKGTSPPPKL